MYGFSGLPRVPRQFVSGNPWANQRRLVFRRGYQGDGFLSAVGGFLKKAAPVLDIATSFIPGGSAIKSGIKMAARAISSPAGRMVTAATGAAGLASVLAPKAPSTALIPATPAVSSTPMLPAAAGAAMAAQPAGGGILPFWRGAGGKLQLPWSDPSQLFQAPYALDDSYLAIRYRAPRGYVVVRDPSGRAYAMMKGIARQVGLWRASRKPPISAGDWHKYQTAQTVEKKLRRIAGKALRHKRSYSVSRSTCKAKH